jgi:hypothetical protein
MSKVRLVGLDVHADTITVAVAEAGGGSSGVGDHPQSAGIDPENDR